MKFIIQEDSCENCVHCKRKIEKKRKVYCWNHRELHDFEDICMDYQNEGGDDEYRND